MIREAAAAAEDKERKEVQGPLIPVGLVASQMAVPVEGQQLRVVRHYSAAAAAAEVQRVLQLREPVEHLDLAAAQVVAVPRFHPEIAQELAGLVALRLILLVGLAGLHSIPARQGRIQVRMQVQEEEAAGPPAVRRTAANMVGLEGYHRAAAAEEGLVPTAKQP